MDRGAVTFVLTENLGHGSALRVGYALCIELGAQYCVTLDADGQNDPAEIPTMLEPLLDDEADFVVASRRLGTDTDDRPLPQGRRAGVLLDAQRHRSHQADRHVQRLPRPPGDDARRHRLSPRPGAIPDGRGAHHRHAAGLAGDRTAHGVAAPGFGHDQEGQELALRLPLRPGGGRTWWKMRKEPVHSWSRTPNAGDSTR